MNTALSMNKLPSEREIALAKESSRILSSYLTENTDAQQVTLVSEQGETQNVLIPESALRLLVNILVEVGKGNIVNLIPIHAELTTQQTADILNVSRPFLVNLLEEGHIPFRKVGAHRRIRYRDVIHYKEAIDRKRESALDELSKQAQTKDMGY